MCFVGSGKFEYIKETVYIVNADGSISEQVFVTGDVNTQMYWRRFRDKVSSRGGRVVSEFDKEYHEIKSKYKNQNNMAQSKVKSVQSSGTWDSPNGMMYKFEYEMEDGTVLTAQHKAADGNFKPGDQVEYEVKGENSYGKYGKVSKPKDFPQSNQSGGDRGNIILYQTCLKVMGGVAMNWSQMDQSPERIAGYALDLYREVKKIESEL